MSQDLMWRNTQNWMPTNYGGSNGGGGGDAGAVQGRDRLDAQRMNPQQRSGAAEYPDGYLSTVDGRHQDKLAQNVAGHLTDRSYQRGIHRGVKMEPEQYMWPAEWYPGMWMDRSVQQDPMTGVLNVRRTTVTGEPIQTISANGVKIPQLTGDEQSRVYSQLGINVEAGILEQQVDPARARMMSSLLPTWT